MTYKGCNRWDFFSLSCVFTLWGGICAQSWYFGINILKQMAYITNWSYGLQIVFKFQQWRTQTSGFNQSAWWFDHKPLVFSHQSWHLNTFSKSRAHVLFRLWTHLCIIHKKHCDWWKWLHTQPQAFWSHSSNTNKNNNIRVITVFVITGVC